MSRGTAYVWIVEAWNSTAWVADSHAYPQRNWAEARRLDVKQLRPRTRFRVAKYVREEKP